MEEETTEESESSASSPSSTDEETSSSEHDSSLEVCGVTLREPSKCARDDLRNELKDEALEKMIAIDLSAEEREGFKGC